MIEKITNFVIDTVFGQIMAVIPFWLQIVLLTILGVLGIFVGRKFIFINILVRFFPKVLKKFAKEMGEHANKVFETKKASGKFKKAWEISEASLIESIDIFNGELKKGA